MDTTGKVFNQCLAHSQVQRTSAVVVAIVVVESDIGQLVLPWKIGKNGIVQVKQAKRVEINICVSNQDPYLVSVNMY